MSKRTKHFKSVIMEIRSNEKQSSSNTVRLPTAAPVVRHQWCFSCMYFYLYYSFSDDFSFAGVIFQKENHISGSSLCLKYSVSSSAFTPSCPAHSVLIGCLSEAFLESVMRVGRDTAEPDSFPEQKKVLKMYHSLARMQILIVVLSYTTYLPKFD